ncbi:MAG: hypothetical protein ACPLYW_00400 [Candidatus Nanoarchaeia archaeon]
MKIKIKNVLFAAAIAVLIIAVGFFYVEKIGKQSQEQKVIIHNFEFNESKNVNVTEAHIYFSKSRNRVWFEGSLEKPTPCHKLFADYKIKNNEVDITIKAVSSDKMCIQVIEVVNYKGSFDYEGNLQTVKIYYNGAEINSATLT